MKRPQSIAKAIDLKKDKIVLAGLALLAGLMAMAAFTSNAHAAAGANQWALHAQGEGEIKLPFQLKSQKFNH